MDKDKVKNILIESLDKVLVDSASDLKAEDIKNISEEIDSFDIVSLLLEIEMHIEKETGEYVTLANEDLFDSSKTPLKDWNSWILYVHNLLK